MILDYSVIVEVLPFLLEGAVITLYLTSASILMGTVIGVFAGLGRISKTRVVRTPFSIYVEVIRGTPLLVQLLIWYFGLPSLGINLSALAAAFIGLSVNSGAYQAEIIRAGIQSNHKGQLEAARSLGMNYGQSMRYVILPQAFRNILPPMVNEFITLLKDSSLVSVLGVAELLRQGQYAISRTFHSFEIFTGVALVYFVMTFTLSSLAGYVERRYRIKGA